MKSFGEILKELGFNPDSSPAVQRAFFEHLVRSMQSNEVKLPNKPKTPEPTEPVQLAFDLDESKRVS